MGLGIAQYDIILVDLNRIGSSGPIGAEMKKIRPCVVISPFEMNRYLRTIVVVPMTTRAKPYPTRVRVRHDQKTGWIIVDQIRTVDKTRVKKRLGKLTHPEIRKLKNVIRQTYVD